MGKRQRNPIESMKRHLIALLITLLSIPCEGFATESVIIAKAGECEVTADDIRPVIEALPPRDQLMLSKNPAAMADFVRTLIIEQLVYKEALEKVGSAEIRCPVDRPGQQAGADPVLPPVDCGTTRGFSFRR